MKKRLSISVIVAICTIGILLTLACKVMNNSSNKCDKCHELYRNGLCKCKGVASYEEATLNGDIYEISNAGQLYWFAQRANTAEGSAIKGKLMDNIVLNANVLDEQDNLTITINESNSWTAIGTSTNPYNGKFYGNNKTISGVCVSKNESDYQGVFGYVNTDFEVTNLGIIDSYVEGHDYVGGIVGGNYGGTITNCYTESIVKGNYRVGGIAGYSTGSITYCNNKKSITSGSVVGGIVGNNTTGTVGGCYNTGEIKATGTTGNYDSTGGVVGYSSGVVKNCYNTGNVTCITYYGTAGVVGVNKSTGSVSNCYNIGDITGTLRVAGVVGYNEHGMVTTSYNTGNIKGTSYSVAGVVGFNQGGTVDRCYNLSKKVEGKGDFVGGIVGSNNENATLSNSYSVCEVIGKSKDIGGLTGLNNGNSKVKNCYSTGKVVGTNSNTGVMIGRIDNISNIINSYCLEREDDVYSIIGTYNGDVENLKKTQEEFASGKVCWLLNGQTIEGTEVVWHQNIISGKIDEYPVLDTSHAIVLYENNKYSEVCGRTCRAKFDENGFGQCKKNGSDLSICYEAPIYNEETDFFEIENEGQLYWFAQQVNNGELDINAEIKEDITVNENVLEDGELVSDTTGFRKWMPMGGLNNKYNGTFDGKNKIISGLYSIGRDYVAFVGYLGEEGTVKNVKMNDSFMSGTAGVASIAGWSDGIINDCHSGARIEGTISNIGGIVGYVNKGKVFSCSNTGYVKGIICTGGIIGAVAYGEGEVRECNNAGRVEGKLGIVGNATRGDQIGGIVGSSKSTIISCVNNGEVSSEGSEVGGIVGASSSSVINCSNTGSVSGPTTTTSDKIGYYVGGIVGLGSSITVERCHNTGNIIGYSDIGGVVGASGNNAAKVRKSYNTGMITGTVSTGGVAGFAEGEVSECYSEGEVLGGGTLKGGVVGYAQGKVIECYSLTVVNGASYSGGVVGFNYKNSVNCYNIGEIKTGNNNAQVIGQNHANGKSLDNYYMKVNPDLSDCGINEGTVRNHEVSDNQVKYGELCYNLNNYDTSEYIDYDVIWYQNLYPANKDDHPTFNDSHSLVYKDDESGEYYNKFAQDEISIVNGAYTGKQQELSLVVTKDDNRLQAEQDYELVIYDKDGNELDEIVDIGEYTIEVLGKGDYDNLRGSIDYTVGIGTKKEPKGFKVVDETFKGKNNGKIEGLTTDMEYSVDGENYVKVTDVHMTFKPGVYYIRNAGNENYNASQSVQITIKEGVVDDKAPIVKGVKDGEKYYVTKKVTVEDNDEVVRVTLDGKEVERTFIIQGNQENLHVIEAEDALGNKTKVTISMHKLNSIEDDLEKINKENENSEQVTSKDIKKIIAYLESIELTDATEEEKEYVENVMEKYKDLLNEKLQQEEIYEGNDNDKDGKDENKQKDNDKSKDDESGSTPRTRDNTSVMKWIVLLLLSGGITSAALMNKRKVNRV